MTTSPQLPGLPFGTSAGLSAALCSGTTATPLPLLPLRVLPGGATGRGEVPLAEQG